MEHPDELVAALGPVVAALRTFNVRHYVGGSVASSFHGAARSTLDVDLVCELTQELVVHFLNRLGSIYYVNQAAVDEAVSKRSCFNLIHLPTSFKVDVFVSRGRPFDNDCMERCRLEQLDENFQVAIATPEDSIIAKLEWYRLGNESSERQWDDVSKLIKLLGGNADVNYLQRSAASVGVDDLLDRLLQETRG